MEGVGEMFFGFTISSLNRKWVFYTHKREMERKINKWSVEKLTESSFEEIVEGT